MSVPLKHFKTGCAKPALPDDGVLRLYSMRFCPFAQRVHLILDAKNIPYHTVFIDLKNKPEWLTEFSPLGKVPALQLPKVDGQPSLIESVIIAEYLDNEYPENRLLSKDPLQQALDKILIERFIAAIGPFYMLVSTKTPSPDGLKKLENGLDIFEEELKKRATPYYGGQQIGFVDYMIWPWFERIGVLKTNLDWELDQTRYPNLLKWKNLLLEDPAVKKSAISTEIHKKFIDSHQEGQPNYDLAL